MLTQGESVEAHALRERGWSVSAIARHLGRDRKTVRAYLEGKREPGRRQARGPGPVRAVRGVLPDPVRRRPAPVGDDAVRRGRRSWVMTGAYPSFTRALRGRGLRPSCEACAAAGTPAEFAVIGHPAGGETQWDWVELPDPPAVVGAGGSTRTCWSGRCRTRARGAGCSRSREQQPYLVASLHGVCERLGGVTRRWRFDRMSTVCHPGVRGPDARRSPRSRSTTASPSTCARRGAAGARAWWRRRTTPRRSGGGGRCPTT